MADFLPPVSQTFTADAAAYLAAIDEMIAATERLGESIAAAAEEMRGMGAVGMEGGAAAGGDDAAALAQERLAESTKVLADADNELVVASNAARDSQLALFDAQTGLAAENAAVRDSQLALFDATKLQADADKTAADMAKLEADMAATLKTELVTLRDSSLAAAEAQAALSRSYMATTKTMVGVSDEQKAVAASEARATESAGRFGTIAKGAIMGFGVAAAYGVVKAMSFNTEVTRLYTAAGLTKAQFGDVSTKLLQLGDQFGFTGTQMAQAMYHPVSAGLDLASSLKVVAQAANIADIHGASLEDTTYSLSSVMKAYNLQVGDVNKTSALLNSIVGQGDMRFQDFNQSIKNWAPTGRAMGISIQSMGAGLAYLTDRGNSAEVASTRMTMGLSMVTAGSKAANTYLSDLGLTTGKLSLRNKSLQSTMEDAGLSTNKVAQDLQKPDGLYIALTHIQGAFRKAGLSANEADQVMAKIFGGGRSDKAILSLMQNLGGLKLKYDQIGAGVAGYGKSSEMAAKTPQQQWKDLVATLKNLATVVGIQLLPAVNKFLETINPLLRFVMANKDLAVSIGIVAGVIMTVVKAAKMWAIVQAILDAELWANPIGLIIIAIAALVVGVIYAWKHFAVFRDVVRDTWNAILTATIDVGKFVVAAVRDAFAILEGIFMFEFNVYKAIVLFAWGIIKDVSESVWGFISKFVTPILKAMGKLFEDVWTSIKTIVVDVWNIIYAVIFGKTKDVDKAWNKFATDIVRIWNTLWSDVWGIVTTVTNALEELFSNSTKLVAQTVTDAWNAIWSLTKTIWNGIKDFFVGLWHDIESMASSFASFFTRVIPKAWSDVENDTVAFFHAFNQAVWNGITSALNFIAAVPGNILRIVENIGELLYDAGKSIMIGLWNGLVSMGQWLYNQIISLIEDVIPGPVKKILGIGSPSKVMHNFGQMVGQGLANGILSQYGLVKNAANGMAALVTDVAKTPNMALAIGAGLGSSGSSLGLMNQSGALLGGAGVQSSQGVYQEVTNVNIAGSVLSENDLANTMQKVMLRRARRNPTTGLSLIPGHGG